MAKRPRTIYLVKRLETLIRARLEADLHDLALTPGQYTTLSIINAGPISSADLARRVGITPQSMSEVIAALERKGLVTRTSRDDNRRIADVALTDSGASMLSSAEERVDLFERRMLAPLSPGDREKLRQMLQMMLS